MDNASTSKSKLTLGAVAAIIIAVVAALSVANQNNQQANTQEYEDYKDGSYQAKGKYTSPAGSEEIDIDLTLRDNIVTDANFRGYATNPTSQTMQSRFGGGFERAVVGKDINELNLTVVNGSSLTPRGFMDALTDIKAEARI